MKCNICHVKKENIEEDHKTCNECREKQKAYHKLWHLKHKKEEAQRHKKYNLEHAEEQKQHKREYKEQLKISIFNHYGGCFCRCCRETELSFLSLDHILNDGAKHRREIGSVNIYNWLKNNNFPTPERFQVLCMNCQFGKRFNNNVCPHEKLKNSDNRQWTSGSQASFASN